MTFTQQQNRLTTHFSESILVVKRRISVLIWRHIGNWGLTFLLQY